MLLTQVIISFLVFLPEGNLGTFFVHVFANTAAVTSNFFKPSKKTKIKRSLDDPNLINIFLASSLTAGDKNDLASRAKIQTEVLLAPLSLYEGLDLKGAFEANDLSGYVKASTRF